MYLLAVNLGSISYVNLDVEFIMLAMNSNVWLFKFVFLLSCNLSKFSGYSKIVMK